MASDSPGRLAQIRQMVSMTKQADPKYVPIVVAAMVLGGGAAFVVGLLVAGVILGVVLALLALLIAFTSVTGRRGQSAAMRQIEGQPGAAYAIVQSMRGDWRVTPGVAINRNGDLVHRVIARCGVVLIAEGPRARNRELLSAELRRTRKVIGDAPMHDLVVGEGANEVSIKKLQAHLMKLPRTLKPKDVNALESRLKALGGTATPLPKGPMPTRVPRGKAR